VASSKRLGEREERGKVVCMSSAIFRGAAEALEKGEAAVLVTVVAVEGAAPREPGAKMLVFPDGRVEGTIGGGALEYHAIHQSLALLREGKKTLLESVDLRDVGMLCGGRTTLFYEVLQPPPLLAIFGAGHVGRLLASLARAATPWRIAVFDDRAEHLADLPKDVEGRHLPEYRGIPNFSGRTYAVVATESHETDLQVAAALLSQEPGPAYLGMVGSRAKAAEIREKLVALGIKEEKVRALRCPVGLPLGGKDPGSVAISILAEILAFHHGRLGEAQGRLVP